MEIYLNQQHQYNFYQFKIDLIVWKSHFNGFKGKSYSLFKIDLIVWKLRMFSTSSGLTVSV